LTITITDEFREKVKKAARSVASGVNQVEADDVEQDIWVRLLEDNPYYTELCGQEDPFQSLKRIGKQEAYKQSSAYEHYSGQYTYTPGEVRGLLSEFLVDVSLEAIAEHTDLVEGLLLLKGDNAAHFKVLVDKYVHGIEPKNTVYTVRAVDKLVEHMNQVNKAARYSYEGPGSRKVVSNSQAIARKDNSWN
jgi:hypothetical protein